MAARVMKIGEIKTKKAVQCFDTVVNYYKDNGIKTILEEKTAEEWAEFCASGFGDMVSKEEPEVNDIVVMQTDSGNWHIAVCIEVGKIYHAANKKGFVSRLKPYRRMIKGVFDVLGSSR
jgi:hypothetical protein